MKHKTLKRNRLQNENFNRLISIHHNLRLLDRVEEVRRIGEDRHYIPWDAENLEFGTIADGLGH